MVDSDSCLARPDGHRSWSPPTSSERRCPTSSTRRAARDRPLDPGYRPLCGLLAAAGWAVIRCSWPERPGRRPFLTPSAQTMATGSTSRVRSPIRDRQAGWTGRPTESLRISYANGQFGLCDRPTHIVDHATGAVDPPDHRRAWPSKMVWVGRCGTRLSSPTRLCCATGIEARSCSRRWGRRSRSSVRRRQRTSVRASNGPPDDQWILGTPAGASGVILAADGST